MPRTLIDRKRTVPYPAETYGVSFNGINSGGSSAIDLSAEDQITLRFVLKVKKELTETTLLFELSNNYNLVSDGLNVSLNVDGGLRCAIVDDGYSQASTQNTIPIGVYCEYVITLDKQQGGADVVKIYVNGYSDFYTVIADSDPVNNFRNDDFFVASRDLSGFFSNISLHFVEIYSGIKTPTQIEALFGTNDTGSDALYSWKNTSIDNTKIAAVNGGVDMTLTNCTGILEPPIPPRTVIGSPRTVIGTTRTVI